ncbi:unnamed protein product [Darwinula stevensoni]|uniref:Uncharacterized protein n=1 Tax=Darwinula stevensoni TaxID=69355 RepID=A0A7R9A466_9CRUS|nr:unnamed protein product [Darwinula stevensoni]CAG0891916.1 unnamed protein product [Darwinula stevensoni]
MWGRVSLKAFGGGPGAGGGGGGGGGGGPPGGASQYGPGPIQLSRIAGVMAHEKARTTSFAFPSLQGQGQGMGGIRREFKDTPAVLGVALPSDPLLAGNFISKDPMDVGVQCGPLTSLHTMNTDRAELVNGGMNHTEGGWPKDINPNELDHTARFRKKIEKDETFLRAIKDLGHSTIHCIRQNNAVDIYEEYFLDLETEGMPSAWVVNVFRDPTAAVAATGKRTVCKISWSPDRSHKLAAAYASIQFQGNTPELPMNSFIWDVGKSSRLFFLRAEGGKNPIQPDLRLEPKSHLVSLEYNPRDGNLLLGGQFKGQLGVWDVRRGSAAVEMTPMDRSHKDPVYSALWIHSKSSVECFSASTDGQVLWWDIRRLSEPLESLILDLRKGGVMEMEKALGASCLEYEPTMPTRFMVGTEQGLRSLCPGKNEGRGTHGNSGTLLLIS